jgi:hypothetical protein
MNPINSKQNQRLARVVEQRVGNGPSDAVDGWQSMLVELLDRMKAFLKPGATVTFQQMMPEEIKFFERLSQAVAVPQSAVAFYLPPSVRHQMMGGSSGELDASEIHDAGVLVASRSEGHGIVVNALFAHPPFTPAVDVYDQGQFVAGYQYETIAACRAELGEILQRHLAGPPDHPSTP